MYKFQKVEKTPYYNTEKPPQGKDTRAAVAAGDPAGWDEPCESVGTHGENGSAAAPPRVQARRAPGLSPEASFC